MNNNRVQNLMPEGKYKFLSMLSKPLPRSIKEGFVEASSMSEYLETRPPTVLKKEGSVENYDEPLYGTPNDSSTLIVPPLNTDIRFGNSLPLYEPTEMEKLGIPVSYLIQNDLIHEAIRGVRNDISHPEHDSSYIHDIIPHYHQGRPENENLLVDKKSYLPWEHKHLHEDHAKGLHVHDVIPDNFSWSITTRDDTPLDRAKKSMIHRVASQHSCGSCWFLPLPPNNTLLFKINSVTSRSHKISC